MRTTALVWMLGLWLLAFSAFAQTSVNVAAQTNGGVATASSLSSGFPAAGVNNGDRKGLNWGSGGGWKDGTSGAFPDWLQINFNGVQSIGEIDVFTLQNSYASPAEPTPTMTFTLYGVTAFQVQYWNGAWVDVPGGNVTGNNLVWRKFTFAPISTDRIRVLVNAGGGGFSRLVEVEAWTATPPSNVAQIYYIHPDHLNTPRRIYNQAGQEVWRWDNTEPFGDSVANENPSGLGTFTCNLRFPGTYADKETGIFYNYFRWYDPALGRYDQSDPTGLRGGLNTYAYVGSNPLSFVDPYGLAPSGGGSFSTRYGNWCGKNWSGGHAGRLIPQNPAGPIDSLDACCMDHDYCSAKYECDNRCMPEREKKSGKAKCDENFVDCLDKLKGKPPQAWPQPPKPGTEAQAYFFCQKAKWWFKD